MYDSRWVTISCTLENQYEIGLVDGFMALGLALFYSMIGCSIVRMYRRGIDQTLCFALCT